MLCDRHSSRAPRRSTETTALLDRVATLCGARTARREERIQALWSGYGEIVRVSLEDGPAPAVIVKHVRPPDQRQHPRGWSGQRSHDRKLRSYAVEMHWYQHVAPRCDPTPRVPRALGCERDDRGWLFVLEDLDASGFPGRTHTPDAQHMRACLRWLAQLHATFMMEGPRLAARGLWPTGTYWHLATRPDELAAIEDSGLRRAAPELDRALGRARHQTLVHGDAKIANFCLGPDEVAAVDFQYVGAGCGMKDVAYFFSSVLDEHRCEAEAPRWLDVYFDQLRAALAERRPELDAHAIEAEWRALYPVAWADFYRFLAGWAPEHPKLHPYSLRMTREALAWLDAER